MGPWKEVESDEIVPTAQEIQDYDTNLKGKVVDVNAMLKKLGKLLQQQCSWASTSFNLFCWLAVRQGFWESWCVVISTQGTQRLQQLKQRSGGERRWMPPI